MTQITHLNPPLKMEDFIPTIFSNILSHIKNHLHINYHINSLANFHIKKTICRFANYAYLQIDYHINSLANFHIKKLSH